jgi:transcriptional regulator with XRE-family HTH domain
MSDARKAQVRQLLRGARARIDPTEVGLHKALRGRAPGLRREDVAVLAGVSVKWYTWLEQGRDFNFSADLLERVALTLRLSALERAYLLELMQNRAKTDIAHTPLTATLARTIQFTPVPAIAMTLRWDIVAWNELTARVFRDYDAIPAAERNLLRIVLTEEQYQRDAPVYDGLARNLLAEFRVDFGKCAGDPAFGELIDELHALSPGFERLWSTIELASTQSSSLVHHDELGDLYFDRISYVPQHSPALRIMMFIPAEPRTAQVIASLATCAAPPSNIVALFAANERHVLRHPNPH